MVQLLGKLKGLEISERTLRAIGSRRAALRAAGRDRPHRQTSSVQLRQLPRRAAGERHGRGRRRALREGAPTPALEPVWANDVLPRPTTSARTRWGDRCDGPARDGVSVGAWARVGTLAVSVCCLSVCPPCKNTFLCPVAPHHTVCHEMNVPNYFIIAPTPHMTHERIRGKV